MKQITTALLILMITGCTATKITRSWKAENSITTRYDKVMVVGLIGGEDSSLRGQMEEYMNVELKGLGYQSVTSVGQYGPEVLRDMEEWEALKFLYYQDIEAVLTIVMLDKKTEERYLPAQVSNSPYGMYQERFWPYYSTINKRVESPGYYATETKYYWETKLYDLHDWKLLYAAQSESFNPASAKKLAHKYGQLIVKDMIIKGVLQHRKSPLKAF